ncbi:EamA family transporter [Pseudidiomarina sp. E22-M8]|uniref:EamA family transporter n=1 Tax=Pseudidiomarina sp. E22-M8 TaxID=3424768 RepID=UPI00403C7617
MGLRLHAPLRLATPGKWVGRSTLLVTLAAFCWGISGGIGAILMERGWDALTVSFYRGAVGLETPSLFKWLAIVLVMLGVVLLTQIYALGTAEVTWIAVATGLLSGLSYALFIFGFKYAAPHGSPQAILLIAFAMLSIILILVGDAHRVVAALSTPSLPLLVLLGVLGAGLSFIFYIVGLNYTAPAIASIVAMVEPVTASLFGVVVLGEELDIVQMAGMALILITVTALSVHSSRRKALI